MKNSSIEFPTTKNIIILKNIFREEEVFVFCEVFFNFVQKIEIFLTRYIENIPRNPTKKEFCQNHVWFLSYIKFSDFKFEKFSLFKQVF